MALRSSRGWPLNSRRRSGSLRELLDEVGQHSIDRCGDAKFTSMTGHRAIEPADLRLPATILDVDPEGGALVAAAAGDTGTNQTTAKPGREAHAR